jgi:hypothetical protein
MRTTKKVLLSAAAVAAIFPASMNKAQAATAAMTAQAVIRQAIQLSMTTDLHFGNLSNVGTGTGNVTLNPNTSARAALGTLNLAGGTLHQPAVLQVKAAKSAVIDMSVGTMPVLKHSVSTSKTMNVDRFDIRDTKAGTTKTINGTGTANAASFNMPGTGTVNNFNIAGRLVKAGGFTLPNGTYKEAGVNFIVNYQ